MCEDILKDILNYITFLNSIGLNVSLSCIGNKFGVYGIKFLPYEIHSHEICHYLKSNKSTMGMCVLNKGRLENANIEAPLYSCCYAGVEEYVIPIRYNNLTLMCVHISGFRGNLDKANRNMKEISKLCNEEFKKLYLLLPTTPPKEKDILKFINPLKYMVTEFYIHCFENMEKIDNISASKQLYLKAMVFINDNYMHEISCESIAKKLDYSPSYMRYVFKKEAKCTVNQKIKQVRLDRARSLLLNTTFTVTEIALRTGFNDTNYFSTIFKYRYKKSPKEYRKNANIIPNDKQPQTDNADE